MDMELVPEVCGTSNGVQFCIVISDKSDHSPNKCVTINPSYDGFPLSPVDAGCFPNSVLADVVACEASICPNSCSGHGTCNQASCTCDSGYYGEDCSSVAPLFYSCQRVDQVSASICIRVKFGDCTITVETVMVSGTHERVLLTKQYPVNTFKTDIRNDSCVDQSGCNVCTHWTNLILNQSLASGCGSLVMTCYGLQYSYNLGCFYDTNLMPKCFGPCPKNCSGHGTCSLGFCSCSKGWGGDDCSTITKCPNDCSGHGECNAGVCSCDSGYSKTDCSGTTSTSSTSSSSQGSKVAFVLIPLAIISVVAIVGIAVWYIRKRKQPKTPQFTQLEMDDEDGLVGSFEDDKD